MREILLSFEDKRIYGLFIVTKAKDPKCFSWDQTLFKVQRNPRGNIRVEQKAFNSCSTPKSLGYLCKKIKYFLKFDGVIRS